MNLCSATCRLHFDSNVNYLRRIFGKNKEHSSSLYLYFGQVCVGLRLIMTSAINDTDRFVSRDMALRSDNLLCANDDKCSKTPKTQSTRYRSNIAPFKSNKKKRIIFFKKTNPKKEEFANINQTNTSQHKTNQSTAQHNTSHHITSQNITSYHITSHMITTKQSMATSANKSKANQNTQIKQRNKKKAKQIKTNQNKSNNK